MDQIHGSDLVLLQAWLKGVQRDEGSGQNGGSFFQSISNLVDLASWGLGDWTGMQRVGLGTKQGLG